MFQPLHPIVPVAPIDPAQMVLKIGNVTIDFEKGSVVRGKEQIPLAGKDHAVYVILAKHAGTYMKARTIYEEMCGVKVSDEELPRIEDIIKVHVCRIRRKFNDSKAIVTRRFLGYGVGVAKKRTLSRTPYSATPQL